MSDVTVCLALEFLLGFAGGVFACLAALMSLTAREKVLRKARKAAKRAGRS